MIYVSYTFYLQQKLFIPERIEGSLDNTGNLALGRIIHEHNTGWVNGACGEIKANEKLASIKSNIYHQASDVHVSLKCSFA